MSTSRRRPPALAGALLGAALLAPMLLVMTGCHEIRSSSGIDGWTDAELHRLRALSLASLPPLPPDPSNAVADDPRAVALGHRLFFDTELSPAGVGCVTCHLPALRFADGRPVAHGVAETTRNSPSLVGAARLPWLMSDGRKDSAWAQALGPIEDAREEGSTRLAVAHGIARRYRADYEALFGPLPELAGLPEHASPLGTPEQQAAWKALAPSQRDAVNRVFANTGKAIAAYVRRLEPAPSRFDAYVDAVLRGDADAARRALSPEERDGLRVFLDAACTNCHDGPLFTNGDFANIGLPPTPERPFEPGRADGVAKVLADPFNCLGQLSDAEPEDCAELRHVKTQGLELLGAFLVPSLRGVALTAPYMHDGRFATLAEVVTHYDLAPPPVMGHSDLVPLVLDETRKRDLEAFLLSLDGPVDAPSVLLRPPSP